MDFKKILESFKKNPKENILKVIKSQKFLIAVAGIVIIIVASCILESATRVNRWYKHTIKMYELFEEDKRVAAAKEADKVIKIEKRMTKKQKAAADALYWGENESSSSSGKSNSSKEVSSSEKTFNQKLYNKNLEKAKKTMPKPIDSMISSEGKDYGIVATLSDDASYLFATIKATEMQKDIFIPGTIDGVPIKVLNVTCKNETENVYRIVFSEKLKATSKNLNFIMNKQVSRNSA